MCVLNEWVGLGGGMGGVSDLRPSSSEIYKSHEL